MISGKALVATATKAYSLSRAWDKLLKTVWKNQYGTKNRAKKHTGVCQVSSQVCFRIFCFEYPFRGLARAW